ncbi:tyrosine-type recombinase/integrase [Chitinilyticum litopenaei]|uniref:tyrosine-type recombinase/integrase n=1 Tax=Chitinilyticum litopenaei TaxID=1121276 RepID=UPI000686F848|nr:integrase arm-type DNA-binding domain-containing protein [Chitinilyticum litopenaei]
MADDGKKRTELLTDAECRHAKPDEGKSEKNLNDGGGLWLVVTTGRKRWRFRGTLFGKPVKLWLGDYPAMRLPDARKAARQCRDQIDNKDSPVIERQIAKAKAERALAATFEVVAGEWLEERARLKAWKERTKNKVWTQIVQHVLPHYGAWPVGKLDAATLRKPVDQLIKLGRIESAGRVLNHISGIMKHAVRSSRIVADPSVTLVGTQGIMPVITSRPRPSLPLSRTAELLQRIAGYEGLRIAQLATRFALLTGARSSEFRFARWDEFDLEAGTWLIPATREVIEGVKHSQRGEKMERPRLVYLSRQAVALLNEIRAINGRSLFVFEGQRIGVPISENTVNLLLGKLGYDTKADVCLHGFRTTMVSGLRESGQFNRDAIERHIGHADKDDKGDEPPDDDMGRLYGRNALFEKERQAMLQWWADWLDALHAAGRHIEPCDFNPNKAAVLTLHRAA